MESETPYIDYAQNNMPRDHTQKSIIVQRESYSKTCKMTRESGERLNGKWTTFERFVKDSTFLCAIHFYSVSNSIREFARDVSNDFYGRLRSTQYPIRLRYTNSATAPPVARVAYIMRLVFDQNYAISRIIAKQHSSMLYYNTSIFNIHLILFVLFFF